MTQEPAKQREYRLGLIDALLRCKDWQSAEQELLQAQAEPGEQDEWVQLQRQLVDVQVQPRQLHSLAACLTLLPKRIDQRKQVTVLSTLARNFPLTVTGTAGGRGGLCMQ